MYWRPSESVSSEESHLLHAAAQLNMGVFQEELKMKVLWKGKGTRLEFENILQVDHRGKPQLDSLEFGKPQRARLIT